MAGRKKASSTKAAPDSKVQDQIRQMRAIRRRARTSPLSGIGDRLTEIEMIANGTAKPNDFRRKTLTIKEIRERHDRSAKDAETKDKARKQRQQTGGHDRKEADDSGQNREE